MTDKMRIVVGISGASGAILGVKLLQTLKQFENLELHLIITTLAEKTISHETNLSISSIQELAHYFHPLNQLGASIASGSFETNGMVIVPCSMKTVAGIASGYSDNLLLRAADVCLKERRKLVICPRETPFNGIHLKNLSFLHDQGVVIMPTMMTFYHQPMTIDDMINQFVGKIMTQFNLTIANFQPWDGKI